MTLPVQTFASSDLIDPLCIFDEILKHPEEPEIRYLEGGKVVIVLGKHPFTKSYFEASVLTERTMILTRFTQNELKEWSKSGNYSFIYSPKNTDQKWFFVDSADRSKLNDLDMKYVSVIRRIVAEFEKGLQKCLKRLSHFPFELGQ